MRITLNQAEIEDSIRDKLNSQMSLREGMELSIEMTATRGDEGFTATINITDKPTEPEPVLDISNKVRAARKTPVAKPVAAPAATKAETTTEAETEPAPEPEDGGEAAGSPEPGVDELSAGQASVSEEAPAEPAQRATNSLFANLRKPVNTPATA